MAVYANDGTGVFTLLTFVNITSPTRVEAGDLNGDGNPDIVASSASSGLVSVSFGNGSSTLTAPTSYSLGSEPRGMRIADMNGDGFPDVLVAQRGTGQVRIYTGSANGTLTSAFAHNSGGFVGLMDITAADFDADGRPDVVAVSDNGNLTSYRRQTPPGNYVSTPVNFPAWGPRR